MRSMVLCILIVTVGSACLAAQVGLPGPVIPEGFGVNIHFVGKQETQVKKIAEAGFRFIRMDLNWQRAEIVKGTYEFEPHDELLASLTEHHIRPIFIFDYGHSEYDKGLAPHTDEGRAAFGKFVESAAAHFKGKGVIWEIWNEPNHPTFWKPDPNAGDYVKLANVVYSAVKRADPYATVVGPALSSWDFPFLESLLKLGLLKSVDAVSVHPYGSAKPEDAARYYEKVRVLIRKYAPAGKSVPVISGEWGYASAKGFTLERQAQFIAREFLVNLMNDIPLSIWYDWRNDGQNADDPEHNCGVVDFNFAEKPSYVAFKTLAMELNGFRFGARIDAGSDDDYLLVFTRGLETRLAAWTTGKAHKVKTAVDVERFSIAGRSGEVDAKDGKLELELTGSPIYVNPSQPSRRWRVEAAWRMSVTPVRVGDALKLNIGSEISSEAPEYDFSIGHSKLRAERTKLEVDKQGGSVAAYTASYVSNGELKSRLTTIAKIDGLAVPLTRSVEFENSACPGIEVLPPTEDTLLIALSQPESGASPVFGGKLSVGNYEGVRLIEDTASVKLKAGTDRQILRFKMTQRPTGTYSFSCRLVGDKGDEIARLSTARYSLVETFASGKPGAEVGGFGATLGGDDKALGEAKLIYANAGSGAPAPVCAKLDYRFDRGWKYVQIVPKSPMRIPERPRYARVWIKGQANGLPAQLRYEGTDGQHFQQSYGRLDWSDWQVFEADISGAGICFWGATADGIVRYPISWDSLLLVDNPAKLASSGTVYVGPLMICSE